MNESLDSDIAALACTPLDDAPSESLAVPHYLAQTYWWAYVHPNAVRLFERRWLVNAILFGNYAPLRDAALDALGASIGGRTLQLACVYGNLTTCLVERLGRAASLDVVDVLPVQLQNLAGKLRGDPRVTLMRGDSSRLDIADACYDQVLLFFLLHEQPGNVRRATLTEAVRVLRPGGRLVIVDYHRPARWHPLRPVMRLVFRHLEPYAIDLWRQELRTALPAEAELLEQRCYFGGLYQRLVVTRRADANNIAAA